MKFDEKLTQALSESGDERAEKMLEVKKKHRFSLSYKSWERKTLKSIRQSHARRPAENRTRYAVLAAVSVTSMIIGATTYAAITSNGRYYLYKENEYPKLFIERISSDKRYIEEYYGLSEESGAKIENYIATDNSVTIKYEYNKEPLYFSQDTVTGYMGYVNAENAAVVPVSVYEEDDGFFIECDDGGGLLYLYWRYDGYLFSLSGNFNKKEAVNLVHSTKSIELTKNNKIPVTFE